MRFLSGSRLGRWLEMRKVVRSLLVLAGILAVAVAVTAWRSLGAGEGATWTTVAAALAVITALITAWNGQRVLEFQEDAKQPYPYPYIDVTSRYNLMQLRVTNYGGSVALNINLEWNEPLLNDQDQQVQFTEQEGAPDIAVLPPGQSVAARLSTDLDMYKKYNKINYSGIIKFSTAAGKPMEHPFFVSTEQYCGGYSYEEEGVKTHVQLQRIPEELKKLNDAVKRLGKE